MQFGHEQLDVYRISIRYVAWAYENAKRLKGIDRYAGNQLLLASRSIPLNIADYDNDNGCIRCLTYFRLVPGRNHSC